VPGLAGALRRRIRPRLVLAIIAVVVAVVLVVAVGGYFYLDSRLTRVAALVPASGVSAGSNWLISGVPGQVSRQQQRQLHTGPNPDANSDTIMLLHLPANGGPPVLVSIPRDSYVPIPGHGMNKINAAFVFGGARLLVQTVQNVTGLSIGHYLNIGYVGLVNAVNAVGGVTICLRRTLRDRASGVWLKKGCDTVNGQQALALVRTRHQFATQDLQREQNQRAFIKALLHKMLSPGTLLNPFAIIPAALGSAGALTVDPGTHLRQLIPVAYALRNPETTTVPIANANFFTPAGDAVQWNQAEALQLFGDLRTDRPVPRSLLTGSRLAA
jgi:LCP family protein required for cell wall assembly